MSSNAHVLARTGKSKWLLRVSLLLLPSSLRPIPVAIWAQTILHGLLVALLWPHPMVVSATPCFFLEDIRHLRQSL